MSLTVFYIICDVGLQVFFSNLCFRHGQIPLRYPGRRRSEAGLRPASDLSATRFGPVFDQDSVMEFGLYLLSAVLADWAVADAGQVWRCCCWTLQVIAAEGEHKASRALKEAADIINESSSALQLRYLQTLNQISAEKNSTIIFPMPIDLLKAFEK